MKYDEIKRDVIWRFDNHVATGSTAFILKAERESGLTWHFNNWRSTSLRNQHNVSASSSVDVGCYRWTDSRTLCDGLLSGLMRS